MGVCIKTFLVSLYDQTVEIVCPESIADDVTFVFKASLANEGSPLRRIVVSEDANSLYTIVDEPEAQVAELTRGDVATFLMEAVVRDLITDVRSAVALHAGLVGLDRSSILIAGPSGVGKSSLTTWLATNGFDYLTDELTLLVDDDSAVLGFPRATVLKPGAAEKILRQSAFEGAYTVGSGEHTITFPPMTASDPRTPRRCGLIIFPRFVTGSNLKIHPVTAAETATRLVSCNLNARNLADGGFRWIANLARSTPAVTVQYGDFDQLDGTLDVLSRFVLNTDLDVRAKRKFLSAFPREQEIAAPPPVKVKSAIPEATPRRERTKLTIGMATYDDYDGVYFSIQAVRLFHPEILDQVEFLVIDNHPDGPCADALKKLEGNISNYRYVPMPSRTGTAIRDAVFDEASGHYVLCMDCHVFVAPGGLAQLLNYYDDNPGTDDLLQGPLVHDDLSSVSTHMHPDWRGGMYGYWATDERGKAPEAPPFEIPMQGLGLFSCRRDAWPGFSARFRGFGGEEGYIHEKFRQRGHTTICLPFLRWLHRFQRPMGVPYSLNWDDRIRNYMIGFSELGMPTDAIEEHFRALLGAGSTDNALREFRPHAEFDERACA